MHDKARRPKSEQTRQQVLSATRELLAERGTTGTGMNQVAELSGVSYGSIYNQFPNGKDGLISAAIEAAGGDIGNNLRLVLDGSGSLGEKCQVLCAYGMSLLVDSDYASGCPIGTAASDGHQIEEVREAAARVFNEWSEVIVEAAVAEAVPESDAERFASVVLSLYEGALLLARVQCSLIPLQHASDVILRLANELIDEDPS